MVKSKIYEGPYYVIFSNTLVTSCLLGSNILLSTLFSDTLNLISSFRATDQVSHSKKKKKKKKKKIVIIISCLSSRF
jgi:hypothetical protein